MEYVELSQIISSVGFPIFCCCILFMQQKELNKSITDLNIVLKGIETRLQEYEDNKTKEK